MAGDFASEVGEFFLMSLGTPSKIGGTIMIRHIFSSIFLLALIISLGLIGVPVQPVFAGLGGQEVLGVPPDPSYPGPTSLWPGGIVHVLISDNFLAGEKDMIWQGLNTWRDQTGFAVEFVSLEGQALPIRYVHILPPGEAPADIGAKGCGSWGPQTYRPTFIWLQQRVPPDTIGCPDHLPSIIHEIGHSIGLGHEHIRPDRDFYIKFVEPEDYKPPEDRPEPWPPDEPIQNARVGFFDYYSIMHIWPVITGIIPLPNLIWPTYPGIPSKEDLETVRALYAFDIYFYSNIEGVDYANFPLTIDPVYGVPTQRRCQLACAADVRCKAYTYVGIGLLNLDAFPENNERPYCFLKSEGSTPEQAGDRNIHSGLRRGNHQCSFGVAFDVDLVGGQISGGVVSMPYNLLDGYNCKELCDQDPDCDAFTFVPGMVSGTCYKKTHNPALPEPLFTYQRQAGYMSAVVRRSNEPNLPPTSDAGGPYTQEWAGNTATIELDGWGSTDPEEAPMTYFWTTDCPWGTLDDSASPQPQLKVYADPSNPSAFCSTGCNVSLIVADDLCLRSSRSSATVTIQDTTAPTLSGVPADQIVECGAVIPAPDPVTATDSYDPSVIPTFVEKRIDGSCAGNYTIERTWTAVDDCGNSTSAAQTITVQDTKGPSIKCNDDAFITPSQAPISFTATATDNCSDVTVQIAGFDCVGKKGNSKLESCDVVFSGDTITIRDSGGVGDKITWTVQATDSCGNITNRTCDTTVVNLREYREIYK